MWVIPQKMGVGQHLSGNLKAHGEWQALVIHFQQVIGGIDKITTGLAKMPIQAIALYVLILVAQFGGVVVLVSTDFAGVSPISPIKGNEQATGFRILGVALIKIGVGIVQDALLIVLHIFRW